jgi:hypothetical protein
MDPINALNMTIGILVGIGTLLTMLGVAIRWMVKHYLDEIKHELKPNGGGSIKDQVNRLEARQDKADTLRKETYMKVEKLDIKIDDLYDKFIQYLANKDK